MPGPVTGGGSGGGLTSVTETDITLADNATNNSSSTKHGFLKRLSNVATEVLDGQGAWRTLAAILGFTPENVANKDTDGMLAANSDTKYASQKATKTYVDAHAGGITNSAGAGIITMSDGTNLVPAPLSNPSASNLTADGSFYWGAGSYAGANGRALINSPADSIFTLVNNNADNFNRLQFGGTSSSYPSLKRSSAALIVRLADDSADAQLAAANLTLSALPTSDPGIAGRLWNSAGTVKVSAG